MEKPVPVNEEIRLDKHKYIMSRTDTKGNIEFGNDYFFEICGYSPNELLGQPHNVIRHPDMPKVIFKMMWERLKQGKNIFAVVKNLAKDGRYYWVTTKFEIKKHPVTNSIVGYMAFRQAANTRAVDTMSKLYAELLQIEANGGIEASEKYLIGYLDSKRVTYDEFIDDVIGNKGPSNSFSPPWPNCSAENSRRCSGLKAGRFPPPLIRRRNTCQDPYRTATRSFTTGAR